MRYFTRAFLLAVLAMILSQAHVQADGCGGYYGYGYPWYGYGNYGAAAYALGNVPTPPYFALHPPVYYSHPVARPYGHSAFACPNGCPYHAIRTTVRIQVNPFVERQAAEKPAEKPQNNQSQAKVKVVAAVPVRIENPYFRSEVKESIADSRALTDR